MVMGTLGWGDYTWRLETKKIVRKLKKNPFCQTYSRWGCPIAAMEVLTGVQRLAVPEKQAGRNRIEQISWWCAWKFFSVAGLHESMSHTHNPLLDQLRHWWNLFSLHSLEQDVNFKAAPTSPSGGGGGSCRPNVSVDTRLRKSRTTGLHL